MYPRLFRKLRRTSGLLLLSLFAATAMANPGLSKVVKGVAIYVGVVPAEIVRGHPKEHPEGAMHGALARGGEQYHVMVALFDATTGLRIEAPEVRASVAGPGRSRLWVTLEPMKIADTITYGNYFQMSGSGPFNIDVQIRSPNTADVIEARFEHKHQ